MRHALSQPLGVGRQSGRPMMAARPGSDGAERLLRRQQAAEELRQVTRQMLRMAGGSLCSGSSSQPNCQPQMSNRRRKGMVVVHNNNGSGLLGRRTGDDASSCLVDRCDSDSLPIGSESPERCWTSKDEALEEQWHYQQDNQMIIPKLLHLDRQPLPLQLPPGHSNCQHIRQHQGSCSRSYSSDSNDEILGIGLGAANTLSQDVSANSHNLMSFKPPACTAGSGRRDQTRSDPSISQWKQQRTVKPSSTKPPPRAEAANVRLSQPFGVNEIYCASGEQVGSLSPPPSLPPLPPPPPPSPPPFCLRIDRQVVAVSLDGPSDRKRRRPRTTTMELFPTTCVDAMQAATGASVDSVKRQVDFIELSSLQRPPLCTSSSNCCGGRRHRSSARAADAADASLDSSLNLNSGAAILCRPGSLPDINVDGLSARRIRCPHGNSSTSGGVNSRDEEDYKKQRSPRDRKGKKRVSFSASVRRDEDSEGPIDSFRTTDSASSRVNKMTFDMVNTDTEVSEIDSDSREYVKQGRSGLRGRGAAPAVEVTLKPAPPAPPAPPSPLPPQLPPPPPPLSHEKDDTLTSCSMDQDSSIQLAAGQDFYLSDTGTDDQMLTDSPGANLGMKIGQVFTNTVRDPKGRSKVSSSFKLTTENPVKPKAKNQDSDGAELRNRSNAAAGPPRAIKKSSGRRKGDSVDQRQILNEARDGSKNLGTSNLGGSNCANSSVGHNHHDSRHRSHHHHHHHHETRMQQPQQQQQQQQQQTATRSTDHCSQTTGEVAASSNPVREHRRAGEAESSYVIFQHPPELSTGKPQANCKNGSCHVAPIDDDEECSDSVTFSWTTMVDRESNGIDLSVSVNNSTPDFEQTTSSRHNNISEIRQDGFPEKVTFNRLCTVEDRLASIETAAPTSAKIGNVGRDACVKPSAVRDSAAVCAVANCVIRSTSAEHVYTYEDSSDSDSSQPFLMLEALSCGHRDQDSNGCSISCRCYSPPRQPKNLTPSPRPSLPPAAAAAAAPPTTPPPPPPRNGSSVSAAANAMRDLLSGVCDPAEAAALTQALVRGLVCNVESLRSALAATLMLLKDRSRKCTGPLTQAIGTADALEDLIRQVQASQQRRSRRGPGSGDQSRRPDWSRADSESDCASEDASATEDDESNAVFETSERRRDAASSQRSSASCVPVGPLQCYAMAHYLIGEQCIEPSLEHRPSLECRPATTRVIRTRSKAINLTSDGKQRRH